MIKNILAIGVILTKATPLGVYIITNQSALGVILKKPKKQCDTEPVPLCAV